MDSTQATTKTSVTLPGRLRVPGMFEGAAKKEKRGKGRIDINHPPRRSVQGKIQRDREWLDEMTARYKAAIAKPQPVAIPEPPKQLPRPLTAPTFTHPVEKTYSHVVPAVSGYLTDHGHANYPRRGVRYQDVARELLAFQKKPPQVLSKKAARRLLERFAHEQALIISDSKRQQSKGGRKSKTKPVDKPRGNKFTQDYLDYLHSPEWKAFRIRILAERGRQCEKCQSTTGDMHVHHLTYKNLGHEEPDDVRVLCVPCHEATHGKKIGRAA